MPQGDGVGTRSPTWTTPISRHGLQFDISFPIDYQVPIDVTVGTPGPHLYSWVDWSNVSKVLAQGNTNNTKVATAGNRTHNLSIRRLMP